MYIAAIKKSFTGLTGPNISDSHNSTKAQCDGAPRYCLTLLGNKLNLTALLYAKSLEQMGTKQV